LPLFVDFQVTCASSPARVAEAQAKGLPARAAVEAALQAAGAAKSAKYAAKGVMAIGGPCAPGVGILQPAVLETGGRLSKPFAGLLRKWAMEHAGDDPEESKLSPEASLWLRHAMQLIQTTLHRQHALRIHAAAIGLAERLVDVGAFDDLERGASWGDRRSGHVPRPTELADLDLAGLALAARDS
jgi:hypothetical protein